MVRQTSARSLTSNSSTPCCDSMTSGPDTEWRPSSVITLWSQLPPTLPTPPHNPLAAVLRLYDLGAGHGMAPLLGHHAMVAATGDDAQAAVAAVGAGADGDD